MPDCTDLNATGLLRSNPIIGFMMRGGGYFVVGSDMTVPSHISDGKKLSKAVARIRVTTDTELRNTFLIVEDAEGKPLAMYNLDHVVALVFDNFDEKNVVTLDGL